MKRTAMLMSILLGACGGTNLATDGGGDSDDSTDRSDDDDGVDVDAETCGGQVLDLAYVAPSFLVVLDRSCSMRAKEVPGTGKNRWEVAVTALQTLVGQYTHDLNWGLTMFPDTTGAACEQDAIPVPTGANTSATIAAMLQAALDPSDPNYPDDPCVTNIDTGMAQVASDPSMADPARPRYAMLVSDGAQSGGSGANSCGGNARDATTTETIAQLEQQGVTTFVVGFGGDVDVAALNEFAMAGGAARLNSETKFYSAENAADLAAAFDTIGDLAVSCTYAVNPAPPDASQLYVWFGNSESVTRDPSHAAGWDYDATQSSITFYGATCDRLKTHAVTDVDIVFGCPQPPVL